MNKKEFKKYCIGKDSSHIWKDMEDEGWIDEKGELTFKSVETEAGLYDKEARRADVHLLGDHFWSRYDLVLCDEIMDVLEKEAL